MVEMSDSSQLLMQIKGHWTDCEPSRCAEILGGILLGPTAFGNIPSFANTIFPQSSLTVLETIAELGLIFFLFLVGLELNIAKIRK